MNKIVMASFLLAVSAAPAVMAETTSRYIKNWDFSKDSVNWNSVSIPHDWAIYGPFDRENDIQLVQIEQNGETEKSWKTGRTAGLPFIGKGYYRTTFNVPSTRGRHLSLIFDGAMSNPYVYVNGKLVGHWAYGYNSFYVDIDSAVKPGVNTLEVSLENKPESSRWYPGAGLYRNVRLLDQPSGAYIPVWGQKLTTPFVGKDYATVHLETELEGVSKGEKVNILTSLLNPSGDVVASDSRIIQTYPGMPVQQNFRISAPTLWSPENPALYTVKTEVRPEKGGEPDVNSFRFGVRSVELRQGDGFYLNGEKRQFKGVCQHHDLGPLGAAVNTAALRHQIEMLKEMGADAIRTSHNMPAPELVQLCDEMGMMLMVEPFDDWGFRPKCENGYGSIFNEWAKKDIRNMVRHFRNNPSVVMWSIGNEVPSQWGPDGVGELSMLQDEVHALDPTRPVTCGMDQFDAVVNNGFAAALDVPGFNYKPSRYEEALPKLPQNIILGSETASTVSTRGKYFFPVELGKGVKHDPHFSNSYDVEACYWSNIPEEDFIQDQDNPAVIGQFVWTGFDYLGEPTPYDEDAWPSRSSNFGIIDLASLPKDRYWLYRSVWRPDEKTLHILPHWNWAGREGEKTPVFVYTNYPKAELFLNGKSQGVREKDLSVTGMNDAELMKRYRLMWNDVVYEPGELKVVAYDGSGKPVAEEVVRTAGKPYALRLESNRDSLSPDGEDLAYVTVTVVDKEGNPVPDAEPLVKFNVKGAGKFRATANGDPTSLRLFHLPEMELFSGAATAIVQSSDKPGQVTLEVKSPGLKSAKINIPVK